MAPTFTRTPERSERHDIRPLDIDRFRLKTADSGDQPTPLIR
jgi:hypothetical protein